MQVSFGNVYRVTPSTSYNEELLKQCMNNPTGGKEPVLAIPIDNGDYLVLTGEKTVKGFQKEKEEIAAAAHRECIAAFQEKVNNRMKSYIKRVFEVAQPITNIDLANLDIFRSEERSTQPIEP